MQQNNELIDGVYYLVKGAEEYFEYQGSVADKASLPTAAPIGSVYQVESPSPLLYVQTNSGYLPFGPELPGIPITYLPPVATETDLPTGATAGSMVTVLDTGITYIYDGTIWRSLDTMSAFLAFIDPALNAALGADSPLVTS